MPNLVLIKHSAPRVAADVPASLWRLSDDGVQRALALAARLAAFDLAGLTASREPKARETALICASSLELPLTVLQGLHEHDRDGDFIDDPAEFQRLVRGVFTRRDDLVFGRETGRAAGERFAAAVDGVLAQSGSRDIAVVAHGTVISLYVAAKCGIDGYDLWRKLGLPSYVVIETPSMKLLEVVPSV